MKHRILVIMIALILGGCISTDPGQGSSMRYLLPEAHVTAHLTMIVEACPGIGGALEIDGSLTLAALAKSGSTIYSVSGKDLLSRRANRTVTITVNEKGVLTGVNAVVEDQTATIVSNSFAALTKTQIFGAPGHVPSTQHILDKIECRDEIVDAISAVKTLRTKIASLRGLLVTGPGEPSEIQEAINVLAIEIARLRNDQLKLKLVSTVPLGKKDSPVPSKLALDYDVILDEWFKVPLVRRPPAAPGLPASPAVATPFTDAELDELFGVTWKSTALLTHAGVSGTRKKTFRKCSLSLELPGQERASVVLEPYGITVKDLKMTEIASPVPQWGGNETVCLSTGFGEKRSVNLTLDEFGQRKSFGWVSEATAALASSGISSVLGDLDTTRTTLAGQTDAEMQQEAIDRVDRLLKYNNALLCEQAVNEGATSCPTAQAEE